MHVRRRLLCTAGVMLCLSIAGVARAVPVTTINTEVDVIPFLASGETQQNAEPSIAVNPNNTSQLISGAFTALFSPPPTNATTPYWISNDGGATWAAFATLQTLDKSIAFNGSTPLTATLNGVGSGNNQIQTFSGANFSTNLNNFNPAQPLDQPWIRTGPSDHVYVAYNNLANFGPNGKTASINVSTDGGSTYTAKVLETVTPTSGQDGPSVRQAVNGSTVYAVFTRWNALVSNTGGGDRFNSQEIVVKSTDGGATFSAGTQVNGALLISPFTTTDNSLVSLGAERVGSDNAIAVARNNANHVVVAYVDTLVLGQMVVHVAESTDGGATWKDKFTTPTVNTRSANPAVTILDDGQIVLLYNSYNTQTDKLSQHLIATSDGFVTTTEEILATENNNTSGGPVPQFDPYLGDFTDLISLGDTFYGIFSASNADDGTLANYLLNGPQLFQRCTTGTPGAGSFALCNEVAFSIDPIFFSGTSFDQVVSNPWPGSLALLGTSLLGLAALRRRRK